MSIPAGPSALPAQRACLIVLDGWGLAPDGPGNAVSLANTPVFDELWRDYPHTTLTAWGRAVGLPEGQMGNSEVGHLNLGAGSVVRQDLVRIDDAIADRTLGENEVLRAAFLGEPGSTPPARVHLMGLVSDGGVHSSLDHLRGLIDLGVELGAGEMVVHAFTDGRDTLPHAGVGLPGGARRAARTPASGRSSAATGRWTATAAGSAPSAPTTCSCTGVAPYHAASGEEAVRMAYERGETDEFIEPTLVGEEARIRPGDSVICFNFRPDRMREITRALAEPGFGEGDEELPGWAGRGGARRSPATRR